MTKEKTTENNVGNSKVVEKRYGLISGETARRYRKSIARYAVGKNEVIQTVKFRLEDNPKAHVPAFSEFARIYRTLEGTDKGTLTYFLFTLVVSGFRLFDSSKSALTYCKRSAFKTQDFFDVAEGLFEEPIPTFTPEAIINRIKKPIRPQKNNALLPAIEMIFKSYKNEWGMKVKDAKFEEIVASIAEKLATRFPNMNDIPESSTEALSLVDSVLMPLGFPSIVEMDKAEVPELPEGCSIVFDSSVPYSAPDATLNPYCAVAALLQTKDEKTAASSHVKASLTTSNNNALSWLFNTGLDLFRNTELSGSDLFSKSLVRIFSVPPSRIDSLRFVKEAAEAICPQSLFYSNGGNVLSYSFFRSCFGGHIDSWVSNYVKRLEDLKSLIEKLPETLVLPKAFFPEDGTDFLTYSGLQVAEVNGALEIFPPLRDKARAALARLYGETRDLPTREDIDNVHLLTTLLNRLAAIYQSLENQIRIAKEEEVQPWKSLSDNRPLELKEWENLVPLPKLNDLSGGVPDAKKTLDTLSTDFDRLLKAQSDMKERVWSWAVDNGRVTDIFDAVTRKEEKDLARRSTKDEAAKSEKDRLAEQVARRIFSDLARAIQKSNDAVSQQARDWFKEQKIFANSVDFNRYFYNGQGRLYRSVHSSSRHEAYEITPDSVMRVKGIWQGFRNLLNRLEASAHKNSEEHMTILRLRNLMEMTELSAIEGPIPMETIQADIPEAYLDGLSADLELSLKKSEIATSTFINLFNFYHSLLSGAMTQLRREQFYLRTKFQWIDHHRLYYLPKGSKWAVPPRYRQLSDFAPIFASGILAEDENGIIDPVQTYANLAKEKINLTEAWKRFLVQMPHDWEYLSPFRGTERVKSAKKKEKRSALYCDKGEMKWNKVEEEDVFFRLIGPSNYKTRLDRLMLQPLSNKLGEMTLLVDEKMSQSISLGGLSEIKEEKMELSLALPITETVIKEGKEAEFPFTRLIGIDQGEAGLAYAVFNLTDAGKADAEPIARGAIPIPSIRRLIRRVQKFRKGGQQASKFNQRFDSTMFNLRENVTGDVVHVIVGLMQRYNGFPVLENQVSNLESSSKQLQLIYKALNSRFLFSDVDSHKAVRNNLWFNGNQWKSNTLQIRANEFEEAEDAKGKKKKVKTDKIKVKDFSVFPGYGVDARYTSKTCSCCGRNIGDYLQKARKDPAYKNVTIKEGGKVELYEQHITLYTSDPEKSDFYRKRKETNPKTKPVAARQIPFNEFERLVKSNLRRAPKSLRSKDTSQSQFFCVFDDCKNHNQAVHADMNAATNIGRRLLEKLVIKDAK